jgi:hypothetical protein
MNNFQFQRAERITRRKALIFTIVFHALLFGGITFGTEMGDKITDTVKEYFQDDQAAKSKKEPLAKNKK